MEQPSRGVDGQWLVERTIVPATFLDIETFSRWWSKGQVDLGPLRYPWFFKWLRAIRWLKLMSFLPCVRHTFLYRGFTYAFDNTSAITSKLCRHTSRRYVFSFANFFVCNDNTYSCSQIFAFESKKKRNFRKYFFFSRVFYSTSAFINEK